MIMIEKMLGVQMHRVGPAYLSAHAVVCGDVTLGDDVSIWPGVVIRGDVAPIRLGSRTNVQDGTIIHCRTGEPLSIGDDVVIGHMAVVHCRLIEDDCLIGIRSVLLDGACVGRGAIVAAGALVTPGMSIPPDTVVMGVPARPVRAVTEDDRRYHRMAVEHYLRLAREYTEGKHPPYSA
jgi:carbonic anhydrase/acetyltransferase-like protein (isoleucine patch superfamily)